MDAAEEATDCVIDAPTQVQPEELEPWQVYTAYVEGRRVKRKPKMVTKMLKDGPRFGWFAWILGPLYYLYRKQWKVGWGYLAFQVCLSLANAFFPVPMGSLAGVPWTAADTVSMVVGIAMGFAFYPLYRRSADAAYARWKVLPSPSGNALGYLEGEGGTAWPQVLAALAVNLAVGLCLNFLLAPTPYDELVDAAERDYHAALTRRYGYDVLGGVTVGLV